MVWIRSWRTTIPYPTSLTSSTAFIRQDSIQKLTSITHTIWSVSMKVMNGRLLSAPTTALSNGTSCLSDLPAAFQCFMNNIFGDLLDVCMLVYLDDILIYSYSEEEHIWHVCEVLHRLQQHNLYAHTNKCFFHVQTIKYLGYILSPSGLTMAADKVQVIQDWPEPQITKDIQSFLGFTNFYRCFILHYSDITIPLTKALLGISPTNAALLSTCWRKPSPPHWCWCTGFQALRS